MKKIFPHKEVINGKIVSVFPYIEEVYPLKDVPQEVVSKMEKTIDHIADVNKKVSLTELWKKGELETGKEYWVRLTDEWKNSIEQVYFNGEDFERFDIDDVEEVLAPVLSFEECKDLKLHAEKATIKLGEKIIENDKLKSLLEECKNLINECISGDYVKELCERIDEVLK